MPSTHSYPYFLHQHTFILCHLLSISTYCSHMTPIYLSSPILTLFAPFHSLALSDHLSPPLLNQVSLIYQTFPSLPSPLFVSLQALLSWPEQNRSEQYCGSLANGKRLWTNKKNKLRLKESTIPLWRDMHAHSDLNICCYARGYRSKYECDQTHIEARAWRRYCNI